MIYRLIVITSTDSYEMWGKSLEDAESRFAQEYPNAPHRIFMYGDVPDGTTLSEYSDAVAKTGSEYAAKRELWGSKEMLFKLIEEDIN